MESKCCECGADELLHADEERSRAAVLSLPGRRVKLLQSVCRASAGTVGEVYQVMFRAGCWRVEVALGPPATCPDPAAVDFEDLDLREFIRCVALVDDSKTSSKASAQW